jgi:hypothetical protein
MRDVREVGTVASLLEEQLSKRESDLHHDMLLLFATLHIDGAAYFTVAWSLIPPILLRIGHTTSCFVRPRTLQSFIEISSPGLCTHFVFTFLYLNVSFSRAHRPRRTIVDRLYLSAAKIITQIIGTHIDPYSP